MNAPLYDPLLNADEPKGQLLDAQGIPIFVPAPKKTRQQRKALRHRWRDDFRNNRMTLSGLALLRSAFPEEEKMTRRSCAPRNQMLYSTYEHRCRGTTKSEARAALKKALGVTRLAPGTKLYPIHPKAS